MEANNRWSQATTIWSGRSSMKSSSRTGPLFGERNKLQWKSFLARVQPLAERAAALMPQYVRREPESLGCHANAQNPGLSDLQVSLTGLLLHQTRPPLRFVSHFRPVLLCQMSSRRATTAASSVFQPSHSNLPRSVSYLSQVPVQRCQYGRRGDLSDRWLRQSCVEQSNARTSKCQDAARLSEEDHAGPDLRL